VVWDQLDFPSTYSIQPYQGKPGEDIEDTIESTKLRAKTMLLKGSIHNQEGEDNGPKSLLRSLDKAIQSDLNLISNKLYEKYPHEEKKEVSRMKFFN
jgi:hypothetical protein